MYTTGACSDLAQQILRDPQRAGTFNALVCYNTVFRLLKDCDPSFHPNKPDMNHAEVSAVLFGPSAINHAINVKNTRPVADSVVGIFKRSPVGSHAFDINHVAICLDAAGNCISTNNGPVGGAGNYSRFNILSALTWRPNEFPVYDDPMNPKAPQWARERMVVFRPVGELLR
jgi:hypothetical protein